MNRNFLISSLAIVLATATLADAGVGYRFRGARSVRGLSRFNFAVSETSPSTKSRWTAEDFSGETLSPRARRAAVRRLQVRREMGPWFTAFMARQNEETRRKERKPTTTAGATADDGGGGGGGGAGGSQGVGGSSTEQTNSNHPVSAGYCYCPEQPGGGDGGGGGGGGGDGGSGGGGDDDDDDGGSGGGGGGGPDPSVVPEPGSFALWALAGCLLVGVTRRKTSDR